MAIGDELDYADLYRRLQAPVTAFDCAQLCAPKNNGIALCCHGDDVIPVLYKGELKVLLERSDLWHRWQPETPEDEELEEEMGEFVLGECKGVAWCERDNRSLNCRTFPFMPYFDHDGGLGGIVYDYHAAEGKCPLVGMPEIVTRRYIEESLDFWQALTTGAPTEGDFYREESRKTRKRFRKKDEPVPVLTVDGIREFPTRRAEWNDLRSSGTRPNLIPLVRNRG